MYHVTDIPVMNPLALLKSLCVTVMKTSRSFLELVGDDIFTTHHLPGPGKNVFSSIVKFSPCTLDPFLRPCGAVGSAHGHPHAMEFSTPGPCAPALGHLPTMESYTPGLMESYTPELHAPALGHLPTMESYTPGFMESYTPGLHAPAHQWHFLMESYTPGLRAPAH